MKLSTTTPWISLLEAAALLTIVLFALDAVQLHQVAASQSASSITTLALLLSLISLVCLTAAVGFAVLRITHTILFGSADIVSVCRRFTRLSNLLIPALCICYMILLRMGPGIGLSHALSAFIAGLLICIGIAQMPGLTSLVWRWKRWSNEHYSGAALIQLTCYLLATLKLQTTLHSFPHLQIAIQFGLLMGLIGLTAYAIEQRAQMFDHGVLTLCLSLQVGCLIGLTVKPPNAPSQLIPIEFSSATARAALRTLRWGLDKDGDGFSTHLGGGDCDDNDPRVHPHAPEIPGNGIDDNCLAGDAPAPVVNTVNKRPQPQPQISKRASVVLIVIDSLRSDRVLYDGHARNTAPQLSQWSRQSTRFLKAFAQAPHTPRSIPSMMTGKYPSRLNWVSSFENYPTPHRNENFIAEEFFEHGYTTVAVSSHWYFSRVPEVLRGFERRRSLVQTYRESTDARETT
ncbi:MAG: sulfatase-like hydrolase/transferase, partial [Bradymonadia bacterium]